MNCENYQGKQNVQKYYYIWFLIFRKFAYDLGKSALLQNF